MEPLIITTVEELLALRDGSNEILIEQDVEIHGVIVSLDSSIAKLTVRNSKLTIKAASQLVLNCELLAHCLEVSAGGLLAVEHNITVGDCATITGAIRAMGSLTAGNASTISNGTMINGGISFAGTTIAV